MLRECWQRLVLTSLSYRALTFVLLTPIITLVVGSLMSRSGGAVLTDLQIAEYAIHPLGFVIALLSIAAWTTLAAWEQASLLTLLMAQQYGQAITPIQAIRHTAVRAWSVYRWVIRLLLMFLLRSAPAILGGWIAYEWLLTDYDINYYLAEKTPRFQWAIGIGVCLVLYVLWQFLHVITHCFLSLPLLMWENVAPREAIAVSRQRVQGHRFKIWKRLGLWLLGVLVFSLLNAGLLTGLAAWMIPREVGNLALLVVRVGTMLLVYAGLSLVVRVFSAVSFTVILCDGYRRLSAIQANLPSVAPQFTASAFTMATIPRPLRWKLLVLGALVLLLWLGLAQWNNSPEIDHALVIAHRGSSYLAPENSVSAIQQAIVDRADWVEIDVQETRDGEIVVTHDSDLMKLANFPKKIWETSLAELQSVPIGGRWGPQFAEERVPTLRQILQAARGHVKVLIELKYYGHEQQLEQRVIDIVENEQMTEEVMFMSLKPNGIAKLRQLRPQWRCGLLLSVSVGDLEKIDVDFFAINARFATRELIRRIHRRGRDVFAWTVDEPALLSTLINRDIDGVITNRPDVAREVLTLRSEMSLGERLLTEAAALFRVNRDQVLEEH